MFILVIGFQNNTETYLAYLCIKSFALKEITVVHKKLSMHFGVSTLAFFSKKICMALQL